MATSAAAGEHRRGRSDRRKQIDAALAALGTATARRSPPPEGRLGSSEDYGRALRSVLADLGPAFAGFGRYLASRVDLLPRRTRGELDAIADHGDILPLSAVAAQIEAQLGASLDRLFIEFHGSPIASGLWTQRHAAWLLPGVPVVVTVVRPDALAALEMDLPLLPMLAPWCGLSEPVMTAAAADYAAALRRRLDQRLMASSFASLGADARGGGDFDAPVCYRDHCAAGVLTVERVAGDRIDERSEERQGLARRIAAAWLRQALRGAVVPHDFDAADIVVAGDRLVLVGGAFEAQAADEHARFAAYIDAVAGDSPDAAAEWILDGNVPPRDVEIRLRRMLRQAVPFRDGEWSGDDRLAEHVLVQWRVAAEAGWCVSTHHQNVYRGLHALAAIANRLAPESDALQSALEDERVRLGVAQAGRLLDLRTIEATVDHALPQLLALLQRVDDVLTRAAEGRLRTKLNVPESDENESARNRTVLLVTTLVAFAAVASLMRQVAPAFGPGVERLGAVLLLVLGGWLLIAAARL